MKRASWLIALKRRNYLSIWSRPGLTKDKIIENNTRQLWLVAFWKKERAFYFVKHFLVLFLPRIVLPGWLHAGQLHGRHRDHSEGVWSCLHSREKHHREIPPTTLWAGSAFFPFFVSFTQLLQVWAADDYEIFKRMMIQKNIDLQMEALELLQQRYKSMTNSKWKSQHPKSMTNSKWKSQNPKSMPNSK